MRGPCCLSAPLPFPPSLSLSLSHLHLLLLLLLLPSTLAATPAPPLPAAQVPLTLLPSLSSGTWEQEDGQSLRASFSPPEVRLSGTVLLSVAHGPDGRPTQAQWTSCALSTSPSDVSVALSAPGFMDAVGNLTMSKPQLQLTGGTLQLESGTGAFSFTPSLAHLLASSLSGPVLGNDVSGSDLDVSLPAPSAGVANGTLTRSNAGDYSLTASLPVKVALRAMTEATGVDHNYITLLGDSYLLLNLNIHAQSRATKIVVSEDCG